MSNEVENYLTAYNQADDTARTLREMAESIERVAHALRAGSRIACMEALPDYPTADQISSGLARLVQAKEPLDRLWDAVPPEMQHRLPQPSRVGRPRTEVCFVDD